ncbi:hypothetical protein BJ138DRAFT_1003736 [Hygrophoropsis aurantiaca]|uniref:Uncharacterized protein n=1 Tax=Hygrophoropsis aurantiaca TaxID=72124 RepID=A0ACB8AI01_9AGAM|nr:hypothetical protein BJ138DRAFT_1003736 [Hygrophoropsis aurantiaca]
MSTNIVLPTLAAFTQSRLTALLKSATTIDFDSAFDAFFATPVNVTVNGKHLSRDQYKQQLLEQSAAAPEQGGATVTINGELEVAGTQGQLSGLVGIFYTTLVESKYLILGAPAQSKITSSFNVIIAPTQHDSQPSNVHGGPDPRRVTTVNQVITEQTFHNLSFGPGPVKLSAQQGPFGGHFGPGPVRLPSEDISFGPGPVKLPAQQGPFGGHFGPGPVRLPPSETGAQGETLPGDGEFGVGPVVIPGETIGEEKSS